MAHPRAAWLAAMGIVRWVPRPVGAPAAEPPGGDGEAPPRALLGEQEGFAAALARAAINWQQPAPAAPLWVLGLAASGEWLGPLDPALEADTLARMLAAIGVSSAACALGQLHWSGPAAAPGDGGHALILCDSGEDGGAAIAAWAERTVPLHGREALIAPHPSMFARGTQIKRQTWHMLQALQRRLRA